MHEIKFERLIHLSKIFIAGGYGLVGSNIARLIRKVNKDVEIILAGRNPQSGDTLAKELGNARTVYLDLNHLPSQKELQLENVDLIVSALQDPADHLIHLAIKHQIAHIGITKLVDEIGPVVFASLQAPPKRPIILLGHNEAGITSLITLESAKEFTTVESIEIAAIYDNLDPVGPMTSSDIGSEGLTARALIRKKGQWTWVDPQNHKREIYMQSKKMEGFPMGLLDVTSLGAMTNAANIRWDFVQGESKGTKSGRNASHEVYIDIKGISKSGEQTQRRTIISDPNGQAHLIALGVVIIIERILGFNGQPFAHGGLQLPEMIISPDAAMKRIQDFDVQIYKELFA